MAGIVVIPTGRSLRPGTAPMAAPTPAGPAHRIRRRVRLLVLSAGTQEPVAAAYVGRQSEPLMMLDVGAVWIAGVLVTIPVAVWWARDLARIPHRAWYWTAHHRRPWQWAFLLGWVAGGWPAIAIVLVWSQSAVRRDVMDEAHALQRGR